MFSDVSVQKVKLLSHWRGGRREFAVNSWPDWWHMPSWDGLLRRAGVCRSSCNPKRTRRVFQMREGPGNVVDERGPFPVGPRGGRGPGKQPMLIDWLIIVVLLSSSSPTFTSITNKRASGASLFVTFSPFFVSLSSSFSPPFCYNVSITGSFSTREMPLWMALRCRRRNKFRFSRSIGSFRLTLLS